MKKTVLRIWVTGFVFSLTAMVSAAEFTDSYGDFTDNQAGGLGITFMPARAILDPAGTTVPQTVYLKDWTFAKSSSGYGGSGLTFLAVTTYDSVTGYGAVLGVSTNSVDFPGTANGALMTWQFDYLALDKDTQYALLFVNDQLQLTGGGIELDTLTNAQGGYAYGGFIQTGNRTVNRPDWNAHFKAAYSTTTPYAHSPFPANGAVNVPFDLTLTWAAADAYTPSGYHVYLDPNETLVTQGDPAIRTSAVGTSLTVSLNPNTLYYWRVDAMEPNVPNPIIHPGSVWSFTTRPEEALIQVQPVSQTVPAGTAQVQFSVTALNTETYQWYKDGIALTATTLYSGEKTSTLTIYDIQLDDEGLYHCVADNSLNVPAASATAQLMTQRLAGWWKLDGDLTDSVGLAIPDAPIHNGTSVDPNYAAVGKDGGALQLFGDVDGLVTIVGSADFFNFYPQGYTVSAWVNMSAKNTAWGAYVAKQGSDPARGFILTHDASGKGIHTLRQMSPNDLSSNTDVDDDAWHLVTGTYDAAVKVSKIYVNGVLRNQVTYTGIPTGSPAALIFGAEFPDGRVAYTGLLDDVRIWSYPLDAVAIARIYTDFTPGAEICTQYPVYDIAGPSGIGVQFRDCRTNLYDFMPIAETWLECNIVPTCI
ncbi:MAG TPA: immunoglobulin domain-containing protein [Anaerohalosphaeraceae bacterium]|nr:immunoglobulin domain-containing protein [Anaerohalosphaeraceae bacterium]